MAKCSTFLLVAALVCAVLGDRDNTLPPDFEICKLSEENVNECMKSAVEVGFQKMEKGIPTLGIPGIEPVQIPAATIDEGTGPVQVKQHFKNFKIYNLSQTKVKKITAKLDPDDYQIDLELYNPELRIEADYEIDGKILLLPVFGKGGCTILLKKVDLGVHFSGKAYEKKGKQYMKLEDVGLKLEPDDIFYDFRNLFNGDEALGGSINKALNDNAKEIFNDIRGGYRKVIAAIIKNFANHFYSKVPLDHLHPK